jgi:hypothetical protein
MWCKMCVSCDVRDVQLRVEPSEEEVKDRAMYRLGMKLAQAALHSSLDDASLHHYFTMLAQEYKRSIGQQ